MGKTTRRVFVKSAGTAAGMLAVAGWNAPVPAQGRDKLRLGFVGGGKRGQKLLLDGLLGSHDFDIVAVADTYEYNLKVAGQMAWFANAGVMWPRYRDDLTEEHRRALGRATRPDQYPGLAEMLAGCELDAVIVATPPSTHAALISACLQAGKHVFCETPMATSMSDARMIVKAAHESGQVVQIGHQRRYHPNYNLVMKHLHDNYPLGRPVQIEMYDHFNSHGRESLTRMPWADPPSARELGTGLDRVVNWRRFDEAGEGPCFESIPRSLDIANWFCGGIPHRVYVSGGIEYWRDGRTAPDTMNAIFEYRMEASNPNFVRLGSRYTPQDTPALNSTFTLRTTYSYSRCSSEHGSHERVIGDRASALLRPEGDSFFQMETMSGSPTELLREHRDLLSSTLAKRLAEMTESERENFVRTRGATYDLPGYARGPRTTAPILAEGSEETVEMIQLRSFAECIRKGETPRANVMVGLAAVVAGEHAQRSLASEGPVEIDPALMAFDFEVPSITGFDENVTPIPGAMEVL